MADEPISALSRTFAYGYSTANLMDIVDVNDNTTSDPSGAMAATGTNKGITVATFLAQYLQPGSNITLTPGSNGVTIASTGSGGAVSSVFTRTGAVVATSGDYAVAQVTGAAPTASPTFTGTVTLPVGLSGLLKASSGVVSTATAGTDYLTPSGSGASLTGITGGQIAGNISGNAASITGSITTSQISDLSSWAGSASITTLGTISTGTVPQANVSGLGASLALLAPLASPTFTGSVTLPAGTVTLAEQANLAASSLMGNPTGSPAAPSAVTLAGGLAFSGSTLTGAALSPLAGSTSITTLGTIATGTVPAANVSGLAASATTNALNAANISSGTLPAARLPNPTASTLGGVESITAVASNFLTTISTSGVPSQAQPAFTDISGTAAVGQIPNLAASKITSGTLAVAQGGTNLATLTAHAVLLGEGTSNPGFATIGTAGYVLTDNGSGADPTFQAPVTSSYVNSTLGSNYTLTTSYANSGLSVTLPVAGYYYITATILCTFTATGSSAQNGIVYCRFYDGTNPYSAGVVALGVLQTSTAVGFWITGVVSPTIYHATSPGVVIYLQAYYAGNATITGASLQSPQTTLTAIRVA